MKGSEREASASLFHLWSDEVMDVDAAEHDQPNLADTLPFRRHDQATCDDGEAAAFQPRTQHRARHLVHRRAGIEENRIARVYELRCAPSKIAWRI